MLGINTQSIFLYIILQNKIKVKRLLIIVEKCVCEKIFVYARKIIAICEKLKKVDWLKFFKNIDFFCCWSII